METRPVIRLIWNFFEAMSLQRGIWHNNSGFWIKHWAQNYQQQFRKKSAVQVPQSTQKLKQTKQNPFSLSLTSTMFGRESCIWVIYLQYFWINKTMLLYSVTKSVMGPLSPKRVRLPPIFFFYISDMGNLQSNSGESFRKKKETMLEHFCANVLKWSTFSGLF